MAEKENLVMKRGDKINIKTSMRTDCHILTVGINENGKLYIEYIDKKYLISDIYGLLKKQKSIKGEKIIKDDNNGN